MSLGSSESGRGIGVDETAAGLPRLISGGHGRADAFPGGANLSAARRLAVGAVDASAGDELFALAVADLAGAGLVGFDGCAGGGNWMVRLVCGRGMVVGVR